MAARTKQSAKTLLDAFDAADRDEIHGVIATLRESYTERLHDASLEFHRAQRAVNRASHEMSRLEKHLGRIDEFVEKYNIPLDKEK